MHDFMRAFDDFVNAHAWGFHNGARAQVASMPGGLPHWLDATPAKILTIRLRPRYANMSAQWDKNPATPFQFVSSAHITSAEYDELVRMRARYGAEFAGVLPVNFTVDDMVFTRFDFFPLRRMRGLPPDLWGKEKEILEGAQVLFRESVNQEFPLRASGMDLRCAYPGKFVRSHDHRKWQWKPMFEVWRAYEGGDTAIDEALGKLKSGLPVEEMISNVQRL